MEVGHGKLISRYYAILTFSNEKLVQIASDRRLSIVQELSEEIWLQVLSTYIPTVISYDRMIPLRYLHQTHYALLFKMKKGDHKCHMSKGTFLHMVWGYYKDSSDQIYGR